MIQMGVLVYLCGCDCRARPRVSRRSVWEQCLQRLFYQSVPTRSHKSVLQRCGPFDKSVPQSCLTRMSRQECLSKSVSARVSWQEHPRSFQQESTACKYVGRVSWKNCVLQEYHTRSSQKSVLHKCPRWVGVFLVSRISFSQDCSARVSRVSNLQVSWESIFKECLPRMSHKGVPRECLIRVFWQQALRRKKKWRMIIFKNDYEWLREVSPTRVSWQECPARVSHKNIPDRCPYESVEHECDARVSQKCIWQDSLRGAPA